jgi:ABC-type branched-subunit amino acid transport system substrate-binding protein
MNKLLLILVFLTGFHASHAQLGKRTIRVGLLTSFYLDQHFTDSLTLKSPKDFPRLAVPGLEFYEGASLAIDSLNKNGISVKMQVFDLQSQNGNINTLIQNATFEQFDMIIAQTSGAEINQLALIAKELKIPFINATHPNDRGIRDNPYYLIANPTLNAHLEFLQQQIANKWSTANILWISRKNASDLKLEDSFKEANSRKGAKKITFKSISVTELPSLQEISPFIDTTKTNILISGSLDDKFGTSLVNALNSYPKKGLLQVIGMPNWENLKDIQLPKFAGLPIYFSSPFYISPTNSWAKEMDELFKNNIYTKASLSAFKGFELTYYFASLFSKHGRVYVEDPTDAMFTPLNDLDFKPIKTKGPEGPVDYFENKKLYLLRRLNGLVISQ